MRCCWPPESWAGLRRARCAAARRAPAPRSTSRLHLLGAAPAQTERDVLEDVEVREQRVVLEDGVDRPPVRLGVGDVLVAEVDPPGGRLLEPGHHPQRRRLAASGRAEQREERALRDGQVEVVDGGERAERLGDAGQAKILAPDAAARRLRHAPSTYWNALVYLVSSAGVRLREDLDLRQVASVGKISGLFGEILVDLLHLLLGPLHRADVVDVRGHLGGDLRVVVVVDQLLGVLLVRRPDRDHHVVAPAACRRSPAARTPTCSRSRRSAGRCRRTSRSRRARHR